MIFKFDREPQSITFSDGDVRLSGVLLEPQGSGPFPAVVFVHGAGPGTHDEPAFVVHANAFLKQGFAVVAYDKRGSGNSTGQLESSDYDDLARDVASAVALLRTKTEIAPSKIGLLGRSEGAWVSTIAASHDHSIAFVILSSGSAASPYEQTVFYTRRALRAKGTPEDRIEQAVSVKSAIWDSYDPLPALTSLRAPLLETIGANDEVVDPVTTLAALDHLSKSGQDITARTFPGVGHSLLIMKGTTILGYAEGYLDFITAWARDHAHM
jgi:dipeptidyl aminopeptidase/acylaminoacyl peptidase